MAKTPYLVNASILDNLRIGSENINTNEIQCACKKIGIHKDIMKLDKGYNSQIYEEGKNLSSGQKQKLAFVRAYLQKSSVILLDEVTSDVDGKCERDICYLIKEMSKYSIIVNISHRELSVQMSKKVFFLQDGKIIGKGTHEELMKKNKKYNEFFKIEDYKK